MRPLLVLGLVAACSRDPRPASCAAVVDNIMAVTKQQMTGHEGLALQNRRAMIEQCEARNMPAEQRACLLAAKDLNAIASCSHAARK